MGRNDKRLNRRRIPPSTSASGRGARSLTPASVGRLKKLLWWGGRLLVVATVTSGAVAMGRMLERYVRSAEAFSTQAIEIEGLSRLTRTDVLTASELALGKNVFEVSPEQARERLKAHPWIDDVTVVRRLPGTYRIALRERQAIAILQLEAAYLITEHGGVFKRVEPGDPAHLPVITGVDAARFSSDANFRAGLLVSVVGLLQDYRDAGLARREPISEIRADAHQGLTVYVGKDGIELRLGARPFGKKLLRFREILDELRNERARPAYVVLDNVHRPDRVAVRLR